MCTERTTYGELECICLSQARRASLATLTSAYMRIHALIRVLLVKINGKNETLEVLAFNSVEDTLLLPTK